MAGARGLMRLLTRSAKSPLSQAVAHALDAHAGARCAAPRAAAKRMNFEEIEPRILHSADLAPFVTADVGSAEIEMRVVDATPAAASLPSTQDETRHEVVVVDTQVENYQQLVDDIRAQNGAARTLEVVLVDPDADGIRKVTDALAGRSDIDALHIISHGTDGAIILGRDRLDLATLNDREAEIERWGAALDPDADILVYGCDVAQTETGRALLRNLAALTGADVAASTDAAGAAALGGDWNLEYREGAIESSLAPSASAQTAWYGVLGTAPVLNGANSLAAIDEDAASNAGTLVSDLIAGRVTDADPGALQGIAVTAVDNAHGAWQYSTDAGGTWTNVTGVSAGNALLLDANSKVRFVPAANWNGTVTNGITFRAWDQTSGAIGGFADTTNVSPAPFVADNFDSAAYDRNDGNRTWSGNWTETGESTSPSGGQIVISGNKLTLHGNSSGSVSVYRDVDLSAASSATLSFSVGDGAGTATVNLKVSKDGGATFTTLATDGSFGTSYDLTPYISANTRIQFDLVGEPGVLGLILAGGDFTIDNLRVDWVQPRVGGATAFSAATASSGITVNAVNDAPSGTSKAVTMLEDSQRVLTIADFGFADAADGNALKAVKITTVPATGTLTLDGVAVNAGDSVDAAAIAASKLVYTPAVNGNGAAYAAFDFQVQDDGGTASGGIDLDPTAKTLTFDVTPVNDAPTPVDSTATASEDTTYVFRAADFGFADTADAGANALSAVKIATVATVGTLKYAGVSASVGQVVTLADLTAGKLTWTGGTANANGAAYSSFTFQVQDDGGTANGGVDLSGIAATMTIDVAAVDDAPSGTSKTVSTNEDTPIVFDRASFGFTDAIDGNAFGGVKIASVPLSGALRLNGTALTAGQVVSVADIDAGRFSYEAPANAWGAGYATFTFQVQDDGGTANGGIDTDPLAKTITIDIASVPDAPTIDGSNALAAIDEDAAANGGTLVSTLIASHFADGDSGALSGIAVIGADNTNGTWQYSTNAGGTWSSFGAPGAGAARLLASDALVRFVPNANWNGTVSNGLTFRAWDRTTGVNGGVAPTIPNPVYLDSFGSESYGANDGTAGWSTSWVDGDANPTGGRIRVNAGQLEVRTNGAEDVYREVDLSAATGATLSFSYTSEISGGDAGVIAIQVSKDGGANYTTLASFTSSALTGSGSYSADLAGYLAANTRVRFSVTTPASPTRTVYIDDVRIATTAAGNGGTTAFSTATASSNIVVAAVNDAPVGANNRVQAYEDTGYVFSRSDFPLSDPTDSGANSLGAVRIASVPVAGSLTLDGVAVTAGQIVSAADLDARKLVFTGAANASGSAYASFAFQVQDDGGTANGGVNLDPVQRTLTIDVAAVNDAPAATDSTVTALEDTGYTFGTADFHFSDATDAGANTLSAVKIATLASAGTLRLDGVAVIAGQFVSAADIAAGKLVYAAPANANGAAYASFTFQVRDSGGTANGGVDLDATAHTMTIGMTPVNDAPSGANATAAIDEDATYVFTRASFGFSDPADAGANSLYAVKITALPGAGALKLNGAAVAAGQFVSVSDIDAGKLVYTPAANANGSGYASVGFVLQDSGGTANGGVDTESTAHALTFDVRAVNDAPQGANRTVTATEDTPFVLSASHFGFSDAVESNNFAGVKIATVATAGTLRLNGVAVSAGQTVSAADLAAGKLVYTPGANGSGAGYASFTFQVQDDGGTANGGVDLDPTPNTITIDVTPVQDAPTLDGANDLAAIDEDASGNGGTLVSALIAGHFGDPDSGALSGIAVTGVDNTHGTWQYSTNGGASWSNFGNALPGSARLLAADARVRFVPDANWNGTVPNGLTFRAWDRTIGVNGGVAPTIADPVYQDNFSAASYYNNDGTAAFSGPWSDADQDPTGGRIRLSSGLLNIRTDGPATIYRELDLSGATSATLSFTFTSSIGSKDPAVVNIQISSNGGASYTTIGLFSSSSLTGTGYAYGDISAYLSANTRIRFEVPDIDKAKGDVWIGTLQVATTAQGNGGNTAFSAASATSGITVNAVNDAPAGASRTVTTLEDTPYVFRTNDFSFSDAVDAVSNAGGNAFSGVKIGAAPGAGTLTLDGVAVRAGDFVSASDIAAGKLVFTPGANASGSTYASFSFQVQDDGGAANGGIDLDPTARTMMVKVTEVNDAPSGTSTRATVLEDGTYVFTASSFGFTDPADAPDDKLLSVRIASLPTAGTLTLDGDAVSAGQFVSASDIAGGKLQWKPAANANGAGYAGFTFQVRDDGGAANGGVDLDPVARAFTFDVTPVNDAPRGTSTSVAALEDVGYVFATGDFGFSDTRDGNSLAAVTVITGPADGSLTLDGVSVVVGQRISAADIAAGKLVYTGAPDGNGANYASFRFRVQDDGGTANGGADTDPFARTMRIDVAAVNDAPSGTDTAVGTLENTPFVFGAAAFGLDDTRDGNALLAVKIDTLPAAGALTLNGVAVGAGQVVSAADIVSGRLVYTPVANQSGLAFARFTFQVQDDGGTANGGVDFDATPNTLTIDVGAINHAPVGADSTVAIDEDGAFTFSTASFGFSDANDVLLNNFKAVRIAAVPAAGTLTLNGVAVAAGQTIAVGDIAAGRLVYRPAADANGNDYAKLTFQVQDDGGTANGGVDIDATPNTIVFDVTPVNDAPRGADAIVTAIEDTPYVFDLSVFGFSDARDGGAQELIAVTIDTLPRAGALALDGVAVASGQSIAASAIADGRLVYTPGANGNGAGYASFTFRVQDDGGTANGGADLDPIARTITVNVTPVNDAPAGETRTVTALEDTVFVFDAASFGYADAADGGANALASVRIVTAPASAGLRLDGVTVADGTVVTAADLAAGRLTFAAAAGASGAAYASFSFELRDDGGTANGGFDVDPIVRTLTIDVALVNDAPGGADATLTALEDTPYVFSAADFGFSDAVEGNGFAGVRVATLAAAGTLTLDGAAVSAGTLVSAADLAAGKFVYTPGANDNGAAYASFTFQVRDDGGIANGGIDLDPTARTIAFDVAAVADAPQGRSSTVTLSQDGSYTFDVNAFGYSDAADTPSNAFTGIAIVSPPDNGTLKLGGARVGAGQFVAAADIAAGKLVFTPAAGASGNAYASFTFKVADDGDTSVRGENVDAIERTLALNVTPRTVTVPVMDVPVVSVPVVAPPPVASSPAVQTMPGSSGSSSSGTSSSTSSGGTSSSGSSSGGSGSSSASGDKPSGTTQSASKTVDEGAAQRVAADAAAGAPAGGSSGGPAAVNGAVAAQVTGVIDARPVDNGAAAGGVQRLDSQAAQRDLRNAVGPVVNVVADGPLMLAFGPQSDTLSDFGKGFGALQSGASSRSHASGATEPHQMARQLDEMRDALREQTKLEASTVAASASAAVSLSVGYVVWLLRGGVLVSTFLSSIPAWRLVDPLPILERLDDEDGEDDDSLESLVARTNHAAAEDDDPVDGGALTVEAV
jgi:hypothetical protein